TAHALYTQSEPGRCTLPLSIRQALQTASSTGTAAQISNNLPSSIATQVVPGEQFIVPQILRQAGTGMFTYKLTPDWNVSVSYWREHESGSRPFGANLDSSPSDAARP